MNINARIPLWAGVVGSAAGIAGGIVVGILVGDRRARREFEIELAELKSHYNSRIKAAVESVRNEYSAVVITTELSGATGSVEDGPQGEGFTPEGDGDSSWTDDRTTEASGVADGAVLKSQRLPPPGGVVIRDGAEREAVLDTEAERDPSKPYVISHQEYHEDQLTFQKLAITYYVKDNVLCDDKDAPIPDTVYTVGEGFTERFGQMSDDPDVVYIRNHKLDIDFEITRDERSFTEVILSYGDPDPKVLKRIVRRPGDA